MKINIKIIKTALFFTILLFVMGACQVATKMQVPVEGHYTYQHSWNYDIKEGHISVQETGTMDFYQDGTAVDSARQVYVVTFKEGGKATLVYKYISPSRWHVNGEDFYFGGIAGRLRMEVVDKQLEGCDEIIVNEVANNIVKTSRSSVEQETKFHLDNLMIRMMKWSYTYPDGHTDTWVFYRVPTR